jgi:hypothetical protein
MDLARTRQRHLFAPARVLAPALALAAAAGCGDDPAPERVGLDTPMVAASVTCVERGAATLIGAAHDGQAWIVNGEKTQLVEFDGTIVDAEWRVDDADRVLPTGAGTASLVVDGELWTIADGTREFVSVPASAGAASSLCGPPTAEHGTFVATAGGLIERAGGVWWQWAPSRSSSFGPLRELIRIDGACAAPDDAVWLHGAGGELWRVAQDRTEIVAGESVAVDSVAIVPGEGAAALTAGELQLGPPWHDVIFDAGPVTAIASGGGRLWVVAGGRTYVRTDGAWTEVTGLPAGADRAPPRRPRRRVVRRRDPGLPGRADPGDPDRRRDPLRAAPRADRAAPHHAAGRHRRGHDRARRHRGGHRPGGRRRRRRRRSTWATAAGTP